MSFRILKTRLTWVPEADRPATGEALVIPANDHLWMLSGPGLEIKKRVGKELEIEAVRLGPVETGQVVATPGEGVGYRHLVHAAVMAQDLRWVENAGMKSVLALLAWARSQKISSLVVYPLYRGVQGRSEEPAREMLAGFMNGLLEGESPLQSVLVLYADETERALLQSTMERLLAAPPV